MKSLVVYFTTYGSTRKFAEEIVKENLDIENFEYKFDIWFKDDKTYLEPLLNLLKDCQLRHIITKEDISKFIENNPKFPIKKFVDFFEEDVKRDESINVDYIYLFTVILQSFLTNFNLKNKIDYKLQVINNGVPNV